MAIDKTLSISDSLGSKIAVREAQSQWHQLSSPPTSSHSISNEGGVDSAKGPWHTRFIDSFRRDNNASVSRPPSVAGDFKTYDLEAANRATAASPLMRKLKGRHLQMIAIGGSIGTGLFVSSGRALATGGPASLLIAFMLIGVMIYCTVQALGEMAVMFPVAGSFAAYSTRFLDPAWGFAMGWNYCLQWLVVLPLEVVAASITVDYWKADLKLNAVFVTVFLAVICTINLFGVKGYGEAEFIFSTIKVISVISYSKWPVLAFVISLIYLLLVVLGAIINIGGGPGGSYIGFKYWRDPGAFHNGFKGMCSSLVTAAFAFAGTELVGLAAAETESPRKTLPTAVKQVFWRIALFYIVSLFVVGTLVPWNEPRLLNGQSSVDAKASPFVISIASAGIEVLPDIMNVVIMISVLSVGNSAVYGSSRTLAALAEQKQAPAIFAYIDRKGRPLVAIATASVLGLLAYLATSDRQQAAFDWMLSLSGLSSLFTWGSICAAHIRFRRAWMIQGFSIDEIAFTSPAGVWGSWLGLIMNILILIAQFWTGFAPVGWREMTSGQIAVSFFQAYLAAPVVLIFYMAHKIVRRPHIVRAKDMDLHTGKREMNVKQLLTEERFERAGWPRWKKVYHFFC